jgi:DNA mismatch repair protein MutL
VSKIALLPPEVSQKIAAGEVIERPFSVVKELVENSLDAGAASIEVELAAGGKQLIRVRDDGSGLSREDALLAFERHSTSKIRTPDDLERIETLGFRGEALASIAAVSRLTFRTSEGGESGVEIERAPDRPASVKAAASARGTTVEVRDLFFNLPARLKFLKSETSELSRVARFLTSLACAYPEVMFSLRHGRREVFSWPRVRTLRERLFQAYGKGVIDRLMEVDWSEGRSRLHGFASRPPAGRGDRGHQFFYVNRRPVQDRVLQSALAQVYRPLLERNLYPEAFLFLTHPLAEVDVNVHPAKAEVRFRDSQFVFRLVRRSIERAVPAGETVKPITPAPWTPSEESPGAVASPPPPLFGDPFGPGRFSPRPGAASPGERAETAGKGLRVLGQYLNMYIVAASDEGLYLIDQHNAHEKVLYEKYAEIDRNRSWPRQLALIPIVIECSPAEALSLEENREVFEAGGFRVEEAGPRAYTLREYPDILPEGEAERVFRSLLAEVREEKPADRRERMLAGLACHTAVKAGQPLSQAQMEYLVDLLFRLPQPGLCPHGRPVLLKIDRGQIDKSLRRPSN